MLCGKCGNKTKKETFVRGYDLTTWAGLPAKATRMRLFRCSTCGAETVHGKDLEATLDALVSTVVHLPKRLTGAEARFLRARLQLTQKQLGERMGGVNTVTISDWERGDRPISSEHDFMLRVFSAMRLPRAVASELGLEVHKKPPPKTIHRLVVADLLAQQKPKRRVRGA